MAAPTTPAERITDAIWKVISGLAVVAYVAKDLGVASESHPVLLYTVKPLLMPALALWLAVRLAARREPGGPGWAIFASLFFAMLGDIFLLSDSELCFVLAMAAFGLAHLVYVPIILAGIPRAEIFQKRGLIYGFPLVVFVYLVLSLVIPQIHLREGEGPTVLKVGFAIYVLLILSTAGSAFLRMVAFPRLRSSSSILAGAVLFVQSDSLIAIDTFHVRLPFAGLAIVSTYVVGQFLIAKGLLLRGTAADADEDDASGDEDSAASRRIAAEAGRLQKTA